MSRGGYGILSANLSMLALFVALTACSDDSKDQGAGEPAASSSVKGLASATLKDTCPQLEAAISGIDIVSPPGKITAAQGAVQELSDRGDTETQNALTNVVVALGQLRTAEQGQGSLDARNSMRAALDNLADRCAAVGSSAMQ